MVIENQIPKTETVAELKDEYKVPSFEEFMETYESDDNLNYDDLSGGGIGEAKGYGPCNGSGCRNNKPFDLYIGFQNNEFRLKYSGDSREYDHIMSNSVDFTRRILNRHIDGGGWVAHRDGSVEERSRRRKNIVLQVLRKAISDHQAGQAINRRRIIQSWE